VEKSQGADEAARAAYEAELAKWEESAEKGRARVKELNARFAPWYYVISGEDFKDIRVGVQDITKPIGE
jgi:hypothetical protein